MRCFEVYYRSTRAKLYRAGGRLLAPSRIEAQRIAASKYSGKLVRVLNAISYA